MIHSFIHSFIHSRSEEGYTGIGSEFVPSFTEIRKSITDAYGTDSEVDWTIVHNAGKLTRSVARKLTEFYFGSDVKVLLALK